MSFISQNSRILAPATVTRTALSTSSTAAVSLGSAGNVVCLVSDVDVYIKLGTSAVGAAATTDLLLPAKVIVPLTLSADATHIRAILSAGTGSLWSFVGSP